MEFNSFDRFLKFVILLENFVIRFFKGNEAVDSSRSRLAEAGGNSATLNVRVRFFKSNEVRARFFKGNEAVDSSRARLAEAGGNSYVVTYGLKND